MKTPELDRFVPGIERLLVDPISPEERTIEGALGTIQIVKAEADRPRKGRILCADFSGQWDKGTVVYFGRYAGQAFELDGREYLLLTNTDVLGWLDDGP